MAVLPLGEAAFTIRLGDAASVECAERAAALADSIRIAAIDGVIDVVASVASVAVYLDLTHERSRVEPALRELERQASAPHATHTSTHVTHTVPVHYDGADLAEVAERTGVSREEVVERHRSREYHVLALGFLPGWAYLGMLDPALRLPRRATPRTRIPAGAVAIAGLQTGIYPRVSPGGWNLIGSTDVVMFDASRARPALLHAAERVRFKPVP